jgi:hypothetical protein
MSVALFFEHKTATAATEYSVAFWMVVSDIFLLVMFSAFFVIGVLLIIKYIRARIFISEDFEDMSEKEKKYLKEPVFWGSVLVFLALIAVAKGATELVDVIERLKVLK